MDDIQGGLKYLFQTSNTLTFLVDGDGLAAMEAAFVNMVEPGERVLLLENGVQRVREVAEKCGESFVTTLLSCRVDPCMDSILREGVCMCVCVCGGGGGLLLRCLSIH